MTPAMTERVPKQQLPPYTSPYHEFSREQRPLLPASLNNADRERAIGQRWKELSTAEKAAYKQGLTLLPSFGRGSGRFWAPTPPGDPTPANDVPRLSELVPCASL